MPNKTLLCQEMFHYTHGSNPTAVFSLEIFSTKAGPASVFSAGFLLSGRDINIFRKYFLFVPSGECPFVHKTSSVLCNFAINTAVVVVLLVNCYFNS